MELPQETSPVVPMASPSFPVCPKLSGTTPGILDPTQPQRLLRQPTSKISFAFFDPRAASSFSEVDIKKLSLNETLYRAKRVVIESSANGDNFWRFVPKAKWEDGVLDEGQWPRIIMLCGQEVECSQDQWDIYKLDPLYECRVHAPPALSTIILAPTKLSTTPMPSNKGKRPVEAFSFSSSPSQETPELHPRKKVHVLPKNQENDDIEEITVDMVVDESRVKNRQRSTSVHARKEMRERERKERREKINQRTERLGQQDEPSTPSTPNLNTHLGEEDPESAGKRKAASLFQTTWGQPSTDNVEDTILRNSVNYNQDNFKRTRAVSPTSRDRELETRKLERERQKQQKRAEELYHRRRQRDEEFLSHIYADAGSYRAAEPEVADSSDDELETDPDQSSDPIDDEEIARQAAIEESRRKLAELEADRPLWEAEARRRAAQERAEAETARRKTEERRREEDAIRAARLRRETQIQEEHFRREREEIARKERERRNRQQRWGFGPWTVARALERYKALSDTFDAAKYTLESPVSFDIIPWPILASPMTMSVEDVDWAAVEKFFAAVQPTMRSQDFKTFVEKSHRRFHPDRWRSRGVLKSVANETERACLEVAANTVAQALTPLWRDLTGR